MDVFGPETGVWSKAADAPTARNSAASAVIDGKIYVVGGRHYDIQHEDDPFGPGLAAVEAAAGDDYDVEVLEEKVVRSYAPHEYNVCLDVRLRRR